MVLTLQLCLIIESVEFIFIKKYSFNDFSFSVLLFNIIYLIILNVLPVYLINGKFFPGMFLLSEKSGCLSYLSGYGFIIKSADSGTKIFYISNYFCWRTRNGKPLEADGQRVKIVPGPDGTECLIIDKCYLDDAGEYAVIAKNSRGEVITKAPLTVTCKY